MLDGLQNLWDLLQSQLVNIPVNNFLGVIYVILNLLALLFGGMLSD